MKKSFYSSLGHSSIPVR